MKTCEDILSDLAMKKRSIRSVRKLHLHRFVHEASPFCSFHEVSSIRFIRFESMKLHRFVLFGMNTKKDLLDQATNDLVMEMKA
jgi:hypothetical protein